MTELDTLEKLIDECKELVAPLIEKLSDELIADIEKQFENKIDTATSNQLHMDAFESAQVFKRDKKVVKEHVYKQLMDGFQKFKDGTLSTHAKEDDLQSEAWSLVDDAILEETIAINTHSSQATIEFQDKLWQLNQRLTVINGDNTVEESNNPLSPIQFYVALREALKLTIISMQSKLSAYKAMATIVDMYYATIVNKANSLFIHEGVLPEIRYEASAIGSYSSGSETVAREPNVDEVVDSIPTPQAPPETATESRQEDKGSSQIPLINTIRNLLGKARHVSGDDAAIPVAQTSPKGRAEASAKAEAGIDAGDVGDLVPQDPVVFSNQQIVSAVDAVQSSAATAHFFSGQEEELILETPTNIAENSARVYNYLYEESPDGAINAQNMYTIDMVGMLFEYILSDENLPDSVKTLLSHLHTPFLKLAFMDTRFFEDKEHKARMLLDSLAEAGSNWVDHDGTAQYDMYNEIKRVVQRAVKDFKSDINFFAELLMEFNLLKKRVAHMHSLRERNSIEKKQGQERHEQAKVLARQEIKKRIEGRRVPSSIISLLSPWFTYLTFIYLREGTESEQWTKALKVIDNLLMYCSIKQVKQDTSRLSEGFDKIIDYINTCLTEIAYNPTKAEGIIAELNELKQNILDKKAIKTTVTPAESKPSSDSVEASDTATPDEEKVMNYIKLIEPGTWIEHGDQYRFKVTGYNANIGKYVLVDQSSQQVLMITRLEFARDILSGQKKIVDGSAKTLFERALVRIHNNLDKQVQASSIS